MFWVTMTKPATARGMMAAEAAVRTHADTRPVWILDIPSSYLNRSAKEYVEDIISDGSYQAVFSGNAGRLYRLKEGVIK